MDQVKWGVLGTAGIARGCTIPGLKLSEHSALYAIAGRNPEKAEQFKADFGFEKAYYDYDELLADPEVQAVYVPLPNNLHCKWVIRALKAGKHVLCEKPLALTAAEAEEMFRTAEEEGRLLMEAYAYLHSPYVKSLQEDVKSGLIGEIDYLETAFITSGYHDNIRVRRETGGGSMYDLGCYCTSMILSLMDSEPVFVSGAADFSEEKIDLLSAGVIRFENGARASFNAGMTMGYRGGRFDRLYIHGSRGSILSDVPYNKQGKAQYTVISDGSTLVREFDLPQNYSLETEQLSRCILYGETPAVSREFSMKNARLMDEVLQAIGYREEIR